MLCSFELMQVPKENRDDVYNTLSNMMQAPTEEAFEDKFQAVLEQYSAHPKVCRYITNGWCARTCIWRKRWPKFGRLFPHGSVDTTNLVERLWQYIKYTLLDAKINRSVLVLLHALVGNSQTGTHMGGTLLEFFKEKQEIGKCPLSSCHCMWEGIFSFLMIVLSSSQLTLDAFVYKAQARLTRQDWLQARAFLEDMKLIFQLYM